jgi:glycosyltransferase involved in cell wall biosynthesis
MHYERNLRHLCLATERAHAEGLCFTLTLIGDGDERADLEHLAERTDGRICLLPAMPHEQIPAMLAKAHIGVLPFPDEEKFRVSSPVKLFEYLAAGLPILATRIACHVDVLGDAGCVFWADGSDVEGLLAALRLAWQGRARLSQMGAQAAAVAPGWTWRASATQLKTALETGLECPIAAGRHRDQ